MFRFCFSVSVKNTSRFADLVLDVVSFWGGGGGGGGVRLFLLNPPSNNVDLQKLVAKHMHNCYEIRQKKPC